MTEIELSMEEPCLLRGSAERCTELVLGRSGDTPQCFLLAGERCHQLGADYVIVQPTVVGRDPTRGWLPLGGRHPTDIYIGRTESPELDLGPSVEGEHLFVSCEGNTICLFVIGDRSPVLVRTEPTLVITSGRE